MKRKPDEKEPEIIDGQTGKVEDTPRRIDLSTLRDVRIEMAALYRKMDDGSVASVDGSRRAYVLKSIADVIALAELERRIQELEDQHGILPRQQQPRRLNS